MSPNAAPRRSAGFNDPHYTQVPDEIFDFWLASLDGAELKCLLYIVRRTFGFRRAADSISLSQFESGITNRDGNQLDAGTGLDRSTIIAALRRLEEAGLIEVERRMGPGGRSYTSRFRLALVHRLDQGWPDNPASSVRVRPDNPANVSPPAGPTLAGLEDPQETGQTVNKQESPSLPVCNEVDEAEPPPPAPPLPAEKPLPPPPAPAKTPEPELPSPAISRGPAERPPDPTPPGEPDLVERSRLTTLAHRLARWRLGRWDYLRDDLTRYAADHRLSALQVTRLVDSAVELGPPLDTQALWDLCDLQGPSMFAHFKEARRVA